MIIFSLTTLFFLIPLNGVVFLSVLFKINSNNVNTSVEIFKNNNNIFSFKDNKYYSPKYKSLFVRSYNNHKYYIDSIESKIILSTRELPTIFLEPLKSSPNNKLNKIIYYRY